MRKSQNQEWQEIWIHILIILLLLYLFQAVDTVVQVLKEIEEVAPSKDQYSNLCLLLTMNKLSDHPDYKSWNPSKGRHKSFREVLPLVEDLLGKVVETIGNKFPCITLLLVLGQIVLSKFVLVKFCQLKFFWNLANDIRVNQGLHTLIDVM